jgi:hypothetical protein
MNVAGVYPERCASVSSGQALKRSGSEMLSPVICLLMKSVAGQVRWHGQKSDSEFLLIAKGRMFRTKNVEIDYRAKQRDERQPRNRDND